MVINLIIGCSPVLEKKRSTCKKTLDLTKTLDPQFDVHDATYSISTLLQPNPDFFRRKLPFVGQAGLYRLESAISSSSPDATIGLRRFVQRHA